MLKSIDHHSSSSSYNKLLLNSPYASIFQTYEWGELKKKQGWLPLRFILNIQGQQMAFTILGRKLGGITFFYSPRGPAFVNVSEHALSTLAEYVLALMKRGRVVFWKIDPEICDPGLAQKLGEHGFLRSPDSGVFGGVQPRFVWRINLKDKLALKKSGRREVEKARKNGVTVKEGKREDLFAFYKLLKETSHRNCFLIRDYYYFLNMWDCLHPSGFLKLYLAVQKDEPLSGALIAPFGEGVWDLYAATSSKAKKIGASYLLTWTLINKFAQENYIFYDLGGLPLREKKNNGLYLFKSRFGGSRVEFIGEYDLINLPTWYYFFQISTRLYEHLKHVRKKLMPIML